MDLVMVALAGGSGLCAFVGASLFMDPSARVNSPPAPTGPDLEDVLGRLPFLRRAIERRQLGARRVEALRQMPTLLDIVTLGLTAGLSFDASLELYCQRYRTQLASSLSEALLAWRIGATSRGEALATLADQLEVVAVRRFASAVEEALAFGTPLAEALEQQAQAIREEQRAQVEEEIEKVPVRMLVPLGTLILPAMLLAILGPLLGPALVM